MHYRVSTGVIRRVMTYVNPKPSNAFHVGIYGIPLREYRTELHAPGNPVLTFDHARSSVHMDGCNFPTLRRHIMRLDNLERY